MLMTTDRDSAGGPRSSDGTEDQVEVGVRTGDAVAYLRPVMRRLGRDVTGLTLRRLADNRVLKATRDTEKGWRTFSVASLRAYREQLEEQARQLENPPDVDAE